MNDISVMPERAYLIAVGREGEHQDAAGHAVSTTRVTAITDLAMSASIRADFEKNDVSTDDVTINIYNLTPDERSHFETEGNSIILRAGYTWGWQRDDKGWIISEHEKLPLIFAGHIIHAYTERSGVDLVTKVFCSADKVIRSVTMVSEAFSPGTARANVIRAIASKFGVPIIEFDTGNLGSKSYPTGYSCYGQAQKVMNSLCAENGLIWSIERGQLRIIPKVHKATKQVWTLNSQNLLSLQGQFSRTSSKHEAAKRKTHKSKAKLKEPKAGQTIEKVQLDDGGYLQTKTTNTIKAKMFLAPELTLGACVKFAEDLEQYLGGERFRDVNAKGDFRIIAIDHTMNYISGEWATEIDLAPVLQE